MRNYDWLFFDLDGTLTDPKVGITSAVAYALKSFGIQVNDLDSLNCFIGPPLLDSFAEYYDIQGDALHKAVAKYREYYSVTGLFENKPYPGIGAALQTLRKRGYRLLVATSKPTEFSETILKKFDLFEYFDFVSGSNMDETRTKKSEVIEFALEQCAITAPSRCAMIGDRHYDITGAKQCGIDGIGVLYGYGNRAEFEAAGAKHIVSTITELVDYLSA